MNIIAYEEKRNIIKKKIKQCLELSLIEIIILEKLKEIGQNQVDVIDLKKRLFNGNAPISAQLNNLIKNEYFKKQRDKKDERRIYLYDIDLNKIAVTLEDYHQIVSSIIDTDA
ncbi:MarR family transcriptional regulator [Staphylococcus sp. SQ8-PEA]|uniref:MarR family transcriptional regulator n=1 Tax=Staphylococcus marylandisciuri TaxID=2981529 RepID=A0ABT2QRM4_9STAP|nr:MarR family transcriptional regulator [Staphylococcus marylandisciuri]MCU5746634.1 MarR family transcriptional regulator [Staphylococcus marylandisciuri]